ncbi:MAG: alkaline phosphatase family protein [Candidatus Latescibacterota bacterium]|nr:MAG: alkaline phosphatase family protein [Candidatus Latescibacterota bacterium]
MKRLGSKDVRHHSQDRPKRFGPAFSRVVSAGCTIAIVIMITIFGSCSKTGRDSRSDTRPPILFFAIDGLEWNVVKPLLEKGKLPTIAGLMERGVFGYLESMIPTYSAVIWTSIATGKVPAKHGIKHFVYEVGKAKDGSKEFRYYTSGHRKTKALWNILSDHDQVVHCVGWWMTFPAEQINGVMVSQTNTTAALKKPQRALWKGLLLKGVEGQVHPAERQNRVMDILEDVDDSLDQITEDIFGRPPHPLTEFSRMMWDQTLWAFRADATYVRAARDILETGEPFDLFSIYVGGPDVAGHRFWRYAYPSEFDNPPDEDQIENFGEVINDHYIYVDRIIGEFMELAPDDATVIIASDHGMHSINNERVFRHTDNMIETNSAHHLDAPPGVFIAAGTGIQKPTETTPIDNLDLPTMNTVGGVMDILPTMLVLRDIPIGEDMDGTPMRGTIDLDLIKNTGIRYIPTHDTPEWLAGRHKRIREAVDQTERLEQLRSLGYIK